MTLRTRKTIGSLRVSPLALGGNVFGWTADETSSFAVLDAYAEAGGNFIDTADAYSVWVEGHAGGESESIIGTWMAARGNRSDMVIATKVGAHPRLKGLTAATITEAVEASLARLRTDYVDLYYTHVDDESVPVAEFLTALDGLVTSGKVREIGASNISPSRLREALAFSETERISRYAAVQPHYNLVVRDLYEGGLDGIAARHGLAVIPYFALAKGFLTGKYLPGEQVDSARGGHAARYLGTPRGRRVLETLHAVAAAHHVQPAAVALAWLAAQPTVTAPLASARTPEQLGQFLDFGDITLSQEELDALTAASD
ncbi:aldo/keto reductase [Streptomyces sp. SudanB182_2057]|uniref:aldo/keto reductase n=1 Tax=Streptomyces sp. SudanB182_2057 TaxID=3035281 RepID=UPI003F570071